MSLKIKTGVVRFSYANVFKPRPNDEGGKEKYGACLLIDKRDTATIKRIRNAIKEALEAGKTSVFDGKIPKTWRNPLRDGDEEREDSEDFEGMLFMNCSSIRKPNIGQFVDGELERIESAEEFYSGCYGKATLNFFAYNMKGSKGVGAGLGNILKVRDGDPLGANAATLADDFTEDDAEDDATNEFA